jgi:hypothetical protein
MALLEPRLAKSRSPTGDRARSHGDLRAATAVANVSLALKTTKTFQQSAKD